MAAEDHLSGQFEILHPHRAVRIAGRMYPAAVTDDEEHIRGALIPAENGSLTYVQHRSDLGDDVFDVNQPDHQIADQSRIGNRQSGLFYTTGVAKAPHVHEMIQHISEKHLTPEQVNTNKRILQFHRDSGSASAIERGDER